MGPYLIVPTLSASLWIWFDRQAGGVEWAKHQEQRCVSQRVKLSYITFDGSDPSDLHFQINLSGTLSLDVKSDFYPGNALASVECAHHFSLSCKYLIKQCCPTPKTAHKTTERAPTGKSGEYFLLHISLILPYMCKCVTVCACVCGGQRQPRVSFFWSLLPWCFWGRVSHWDLGPTDQAKLAGQKPLLLSTGIIYDWPLTLKNKQ